MQQLDAPAARLTRREAELVDVVEAHQNLERRFSAVVVLLQEQDADLEAKTKRLTSREAELTEATETRLSLTKQLAETQRAVDEAIRDRSAIIRQAAQRQSVFEAVLREQVAKSDMLAEDLSAIRQELAHANRALREAEARHALAMTTAASQFNEQEVRHEARMAAATAVRDATSQQLHEATETLDKARQAHLANATAAAERLAQQEAMLREAIASRQMLEEQLAGAESALQAAEQRAAAERLDDKQRAAERDVEFSARLQREAATREAVERTLVAARNKVAETETAIRDAEQRHASEIAKVTSQLADQQVQYERRLAEATTARDLVDLRLREIEASFERSLEEAAKNAAAAAERLVRLEAQRVEAVANLQTVEGQLADANAALHVAEQRMATERLAAERQAAQRQTEFAAAIALETAGRHAAGRELATSQQDLAESKSALRSAEQRHASEMTTVAAQLADQQVHYETRLAETAAARDLVDQRLREIEASFELSRQEAAVNAAAAAERLVRLEAQRVEDLANLQRLEGQLADANAALHVAEQRTAAERLDAERQAAQRQTEYEAAIARETAGRHAAGRELTTSRQDLAESKSALRNAEERHASAMTSAAAQFAERQTELEAQLSRVASAHAVLEQDRLDAEQRHASEKETAARLFAERQRAFETRLAEITAVKDASDLRLREAEARLERIHDERASEAIAVANQRTQLESELAAATASTENLERRLTELMNDLYTAEQLVMSERIASAEHAAARQMEFDARLALELGTRNTIEQALTGTRQDLLQTQTCLAEITTAREIISQQLHDTETTLARIRQERDADALAFADQLSERESEIAAATAIRKVLEGRLDDTETALRDAEVQAVARHTATLQQSAERQAQFDVQFAREIEARTVVERDLAETRVVADQTRKALLGESAALAAQMRELDVRLTGELARERTEHERQRTDWQTELRALTVDRDALRELLATSQTQFEILSSVHEDANENFERIRQAKEIELQCLGDDCVVLRQTLDEVRADALQTLQRVESKHSAEIARINGLVAERDGQLKDQMLRHAASQEADQRALAKLENELSVALTDHRKEMERVHSSLNAAMQDFDEMRRHCDTVQLEADRVPLLTNQLEASRAESRRQFDESPIGIVRCNRAGVLKDANRSLITTLGYETVDELRSPGLPASVFESPDDFRWLLENCSAPSESIDWIWKKKDGSRLMMRLRVLRVSAEVVEIAAEDVTTLREVEERLRRAQRMEAVGRLTAEVADTCDILLRNVSQEVQLWLTTVGSNSSQRHHGELILGDVTRAVASLRQLSAYAETETNAPAGVDIHAVLRQLAPILKRVAGHDIELVLPKKVTVLNVDVDADRVERILVNITTYGRERMPSGGRLSIELTRVVVDRDFVAKYPNLRPGAYALISVAKVRTAARAELSIDGRKAVEAATSGASSERPGVDLGLLQALVDDCGGHLWMNAETGGDMELKIHLPLRSDDVSKSAGGIRSVLGRSISTLFRST